MEHASLFRQCLTTLDVPLMRRLWKHVAPHLPQPKTDIETLLAMHMARVRMMTLPEEARAYSEQWLIDHRVARDTFAVGISVKAASSPDPGQRRRGVYVQNEMAYSVEQSLRFGIRLDDPKDAAEVKRRMMVARERA